MRFIFGAHLQTLTVQMSIREFGKVLRHVLLLYAHVCVCALGWLRSVRQTLF